MDHRDLQAFLELSSQLHFGKAAEACHMTPSTLSRLIKRLEDEVGQALFVRDKRQVALTYAGEQLQVYARDVQAQWARLQDALGIDARSLQGQLSIYCSVTASYSVLAPILPVVRERLPGLEIQMSTGDQAESLGKVIDGEVDLAIAASPGEMPAEVEFLPLAEAQLQLIGPAIQCQVAEQLSDSVIDYSGLPFIVPERGVARALLELWWRQRRIAPPVYAHVSGHEAVVSMVALGFGVAMVPDLVVGHSPLQSDIVEIPLDDYPPSFHVGLCCRRERMDQPMIQAFWSLAMESRNY